MHLSAAIRVCERQQHHQVVLLQIHSCAQSRLCHPQPRRHSMQAPISHAWTLIMLLCPVRSTTLSFQTICRHHSLRSRVLFFLLYPLTDPINSIRPTCASSGPCCSDAPCAWPSSPEYCPCPVTGTNPRAQAASTCSIRTAISPATSPRASSRQQTNDLIRLCTNAVAFCRATIACTRC